MTETEKVRQTRVGHMKDSGLFLRVTGSQKSLKSFKKSEIIKIPFFKRSTLTKQKRFRGERSGQGKPIMMPC